jgi:CO/xanthine dehydrogenase Mo-binding subunit
MTSTETTPETAGVGVRRRRLDAVDKVTGRASYAGDGAHRGMLHGRPVLSPYAHARIVAIDTTAALELPGVHAVLTAADMPIKGGTGRGAEPLAKSEVVFAGQPVALVVANTEAAAEDGAEAVFVEYEPLTPVVDLEQAIDPGSPPARLESVKDETDVGMHGDSGTGVKGDGEGEGKPANLLDHSVFAEGDVDAELLACADVVEGRFRTSWVHQAYLEPQVALAWPEGDGGLAVRSSTQGTFWVRQELARLFDLPLTKIRVEAAVLGGAFGGKLRLLEPLVAGAALALSRPIRVVLTRSEDFAATNPGPGFVFDVRVGAHGDGRLAALDARFVGDSGAFTDSSTVGLSAGRIGGAYSFETWRVNVYNARTNKFGAGAYRAPNATPCAFVLESLVDELAGRLGIDPIELRLRNVPEAGDLQLNGTRWPALGLRETLEAIRDHPLWLRRHDLPANEGIGVAAGLFPGGTQGAGAVCRMNSDGGLTVVSGYIDMTGTDTAMAAIVAEVVGIAAERVTVVSGDTNDAPHGGLSAGSMVTYCLGSAVLAAATDAREQILRVAGDELEIDPRDLEIVDGIVRAAGAPQRGVSIDSIAAKVTGFGGSYPPIEGHGTAAPPEIAPSVAAALAHVRVDVDTGEVKILRYVAAQDCGHALNPALVEGQMHGGAVQSIGWALGEELLHDEDGNLLTGSFLNYAIPKINTVPEIETIVVEVPSPHGPLGARGIGESAIVPGAAAIANAIAAATGKRLYELPMTPERVWHSLASPEQ